MFDIDKEVAKFTDFVPFENYEDYKKLSSEEKKEYNYRLKIYRDWWNIIDTSFRDKKIKERKEQKDEGIIQALKWVCSVWKLLLKFLKNQLNIF